MLSTPTPPRKITFRLFAESIYSLSQVILLCTNTTIHSDIRLVSVVTSLNASSFSDNEESNASEIKITIALLLVILTRTILYIYYLFANYLGSFLQLFKFNSSQFPYYYPNQSS